MSAPCPRCGIAYDTVRLGACPGCFLRPAGADAVLVAGGTLELQDEIGEDACGPVYRARDLRTKAIVAVRFPPATREGELRALAALRHPAIARVLDFGIEDGEPYVVCELPPGRPLPRVLPLATRRAVEVALAVAEALAHAHERGLFHGDLRPDDVVVDRAGRATLARFGLVPLLAPDPPPASVAADVAALVGVLARALAAREDLDLLPASLDRLVRDGAAPPGTAADLARDLRAALADLDRRAAPPWRSVRGVSLDPEDQR